MRWVVVVALLLSADAIAADLTPIAIATPEPTPEGPSPEEIRAEHARGEKEKEKIDAALVEIKQWIEEMGRRKAGEKKR